MGSFSGLGTFELYTAVCGSCASLLCSLLPWCPCWTSFFPSLCVDVRRRIELIQDFEMPTVCTTIKVSKDGQYILATGKHLCGCNLHVLDSRKRSSRKGHPPCLSQCLLIITSDAQKRSGELNEHLFTWELDSSLNSLLCFSINTYRFF